MPSSSHAKQRQGSSPIPPRAARSTHSDSCLRIVSHFTIIEQVPAHNEDDDDGLFCVGRNVFMEFSSSAVTPPPPPPPPHGFVASIASLTQHPPSACLRTQQGFRPFPQCLQSLAD